MPEAEAILRRLDRILAELIELRAELAATRLDDDEKGLSNVYTLADDLSPGNLVDTHAAAARFGFPRDKIAKWCREGSGVKRGGRWLASVPRLRERINGK